MFTVVSRKPRTGVRGGASARAAKSAAQARGDPPLCTHCRNLNQHRGALNQLDTAHWVRMDPTKGPSCPVLAQTKCVHCFTLGHTKSMCRFLDQKFSARTLDKPLKPLFASASSAALLAMLRTPEASAVLQHPFIDVRFPTNCFNIPEKPLYAVQCAPSAPQKMCFRITNWANESGSDSDNDLEAFVPATFIA